MRFYPIKIVFLIVLFSLANAAYLKAAPCFCNDSCSCCEQPACWQGLYLNGQVGGAFVKHRYNFTNDNFFNTLGPTVLGSRFNITKQGFIGGGAVGYNYQCGCLVIGIEGGALGADLKKSRTSPFFPDTDTFSSKLEWLGFAKVRIGYAFNNFLPFVTGGWAGGDVKLKLSDPSSGVFASSKNWVNGWTAGAGIDYKLSDCFSVGIAYDFVQLNHTKGMSCSNCGTGAGFGTPRSKDRLNIQAVVFRLNYHLNFF